METTIMGTIYWGYIGIVEKIMEITIIIAALQVKAEGVATTGVQIRHA